jgi:hypothetical protein
MKTKTKTCGIYKITCKETGKCYIGQSKNIEGRWKTHHGSYPLQDFDYEIIRTTKVVAFLNGFEKYYISLYDSHRNGFNKTIGGTNIKVIVVDENTRKKLSAVNKGKKRTDETKAKMSNAGKGKKRTDEHRSKISAAVKNAPKLQCPHCFKLIGACNLKRWHGDQCKEKTSTLV